LGCDEYYKTLERIAKIKGVKLEKLIFHSYVVILSNISDYVRQIDTATFKLLKEPLGLILLFYQVIIICLRIQEENNGRDTCSDNSIALEIVRQLEINSLYFHS
jgi:hypothetical protein